MVITPNFNVSPFEKSPVAKRVDRIERLRNRDKFKERKRRQKLGEMVPTRISAKLTEQVLKRYNYQCIICGYEGKRGHGIGLEIDHEIPEAMGGATDLDNLRPLCPQHHDILGMKRTRDPFYLLSDLLAGEEITPELQDPDPAYATLYIEDGQLWS